MDLLGWGADFLRILLAGIALLAIGIDGPDGLEPGGSYVEDEREHFGFYVFYRAIARRLGRGCATTLYYYELGSLGDPPPYLHYGKYTWCLGTYEYSFRATCFK